MTHLLECVGMIWSSTLKKKVLGLSATLPNVEDIAKWNPGSRPNHLWQMPSRWMRSESSGELWITPCIRLHAMICATECGKNLQEACTSHQLRLNAVLYRTAYRPVPLQEYVLSGHELLKPDGSKAAKRFKLIAREIACPLDHCSSVCMRWQAYIRTKPRKLHDLSSWERFSSLTSYY